MPVTENTILQPAARSVSEQGSLLTRRLYDAAAPFYTVSARLFHQQAHTAALTAASVENGMRVLELATGSGEMFTRLLELNPDGHTVGVDLSPNMAAHTQGLARRMFPGSSAHCYAADARDLPFANGSFDAVIGCYLFELLPRDTVEDTLAELRRVLTPGGRLTAILVSQTSPGFNVAYRLASKLVPAFWGHQIDDRFLDLLARYGFSLCRESYVTQTFYASHIVSATASSRV